MHVEELESSHDPQDFSLILLAFKVVSSNGAGSLTTASHQMVVTGEKNVPVVMNLEIRAMVVVHFTENSAST